MKPARVRKRGGVKPEHLFDVVVTFLALVVFAVVLLFVVDAIYLFGGR